jgi:multidrug transporter EmrE-like cation transporter
VWILAGAAYSLDGAGMKLAQGRGAVAVLAVYACFVLGAALQMRSLRYTDFGTGYVLVLGLEAALSIGVATLLFGERPNVGQWAWIGMVLAGAALLRS